MDNLNIDWDPSWDDIDTTQTEVADFEGGKLYKMNPCDLVVLSGTYREMGRQYGHLLKDGIVYMRDLLKKEFIDTPGGAYHPAHPTGVMTYEEMRDLAADGYYKGKPKHHKEMLIGMAETTGLSLEEHAILDDMLDVVMWSRNVNMCTSIACWDDKSSDGSLFTARNHDFSLAWRQCFETAGAFVVRNPTGASISHAFAVRAGQGNNAVDAINSAGLYVEVNNAWNISSYLSAKERSISNWLVQLVEDYTSVDEVDCLLPNIRASAGLNILAADSTQARYYEVGPVGSSMTKPEFGTMTARANLAYSDEFQLPDSYPDRVAEHSKPRRDNIVKHFSDDPSTNDVAKARAYLNKEIVVDGEIANGSATFPELHDGHGQLHVVSDRHQARGAQDLVAHPHDGALAGDRSHEALHREVVVRRVRLRAA